MFLGRVRLLLGSEHVEGLDHAETCVARFDDIVYVAIFGCLVPVSYTHLTLPTT